MIVKAPRRRQVRIEALELRQLMSAVASVSSSLLVFNAVKNNTTGMTQTVTLADTGDAPLNISSVTLTTDAAGTSTDPARFTIVNAASVPTQLLAGQTFDLQIKYLANAAPVLNRAILNVVSDDPATPSLGVSLHGIGTKALGGVNQPSLPAILRAYNIPTVTGDGANDANIYVDGSYPNPPDATSQEVNLQKFVKAGTGPVTVQVLASFTAAGAHPYTLGTYTPGNGNDLHELFYTPTAEYQTTLVHPQGATSFDPAGNAFGFYFVSNVQVKGRVGYSEDSLNTWDTTNNRKFRFFPLKNADGSGVANAYVMTTTEWDAPVGYDFTNIVAIVRNVQAAPNAPAAPSIGLQDLNALPGSSKMIFNYIQSPNTTYGDIVHNVGTLRVNNTGGQPLVITSYTLSSQWSFVGAPTLPITIAAGSFRDLQLKFVATQNPTVPYNETNSPSYPSGGGVYNGTITLTSNDPNTPTVSKSLTGWRQFHSENSNEPSLQSIVNLLAGWSTNINATPIPELSESLTTGTSTATYYGEEVASNYWNSADPTQPVNLRKIAGYHTEGEFDTTYWYVKGTRTYSKLFVTDPDASQTLFPVATGTTTPAAGSFTTSSTFGFRVDNEYSDDTQNTTLSTGGGHHFRFFPVRDSAGTLVANTYIMTMDYSNTPQNFDFQDNVYVVTNIRPSGSPPTPVDSWASATASGVSLQWAPVTYATLAGYNVYRSTSATGTYSLLTPTPVTAVNYLDTTGTAGTNYYYRIAAVDSVTTTLQSLGATATTVATTTTTGPTGNGTGHPVAAAVSLATTAGFAVSVNVAAKASDVNATLLPATVVVSTAPTNGTTSVDTTTGTITYTPNAGYSGGDTFRYTISDTTGAISTPALVSVTVSAQPVGSPVAANLSYTTPYNTPIDVNVVAAATDATATILASGVVITTPPTNGTAVVNATTGVITYTPAAGYTGADSVAYTVSDTLQAVSEAATISLTVGAAPLGPPIAVDLTGSTVVNGAAAFDVAGAATIVGAAINPASVLVSTQPAHGTSTVDATTGVISYTPAGNYVGVDTFQYTLADTAGKVSVPATLSLEVGVLINSTSAKSLVFTDANGSVVTLQLTGPGTGTVYFNGTGTYTNRLARNGTGTVTLTGDGLSIKSIVATGTGPGSGLVVNRRGAAAVAMGNISVTGSLGKIVAPTTSFNGTLSITGGLGTLQIAGANGATFTVGSDAAIPTGLNFSSGAIVDTTLSSAEPIRSLKAASWTGDSLAAPSIASLVVAGDFAPTLTLTGGTPFALGNTRIGGQITSPTWAVTGNASNIVAGSVASHWNGHVTGSVNMLTVRANGFAGAFAAATINNVTIAGTDTGSILAGSIRTVKIVGQLNGGSITLNDTTGTAQTLGRLTVTGGMVNAAVHSAAGIGSVVSAGIAGSTITAGSTDPLALSAASFSSEATIGSVSVTGRGSTFANSNLTAAHLGALNLGTVPTANAGVTFGVAAETINSLIATLNPGGTLRLNRAALATSDTITAYLTLHNLSLGEFVVRKV